MRNISLVVLAVACSLLIIYMMIPFSGMDETGILYRNESDSTYEGYVRLKSRHSSFGLSIFSTIGDPRANILTSLDVTNLGNETITVRVCNRFSLDKIPEFTHDVELAPRETVEAYRGVATIASYLSFPGDEARLKVVVYGLNEHFSEKKIIVRSQWGDGP